MKLPPISRYPSHMLIGEEEYRVRLVKCIRRDNKLMGLFCPSTRTIYIRKGQSAAEIFYTFVHELLHAFEEEYAIRISHETVYKLERAIGDLLLNNF